MGHLALTSYPVWINADLPFAVPRYPECRLRQHDEEHQASSRRVLFVTRNGPAGSAGPVRSGLDGLDLEVNVDVVAEQRLVATERDVELDAVLLAADRGGGAEADTRATPGVGVGAVELHVQRDRTGDLADGERAVEEVVGPVLPYAGGGERHDRVVVQVEDLGGPDVGVTVGVARVDRLDLDLDGGLGIRHVLGDLQRAGEFGER